MYPIDRRLVAAHVYSLLASLRKTAMVLMVGHTTIARWLKTPNKQQYTRRTNKVYKSDVIVGFLKTVIQCDPFVSLKLLQEKIKVCLGVSVSKELVRTAIARLGLTKKKARFYGKSQNQEARTREFLQKRQQFQEQNRMFVSIDETSFGRNGIEIKGYAPRGVKLHIQRIPERTVTTSAVCCVSNDGIISYATKQGSYNTDSFVSFIESLNLQEKTVVLMDNVSFHKSRKVSHVFQERNVEVLFTPPYSPWFNPIELCFSIVKRDYYKNGSISKAFETLSSQHCIAFFDKSLNCYGAF